MDIPNPTAPTLRDVSDVLPIIQLPPAQKLKTNHQFAPSVEEITQRITEDAKSTRIYKGSTTVKTFQIKNTL